MKNKMIIISISSLLVFLFAYTGMTKLLDNSNFRIYLGKSPFITSMAGFIAWMLPAGELIIALALTTPRLRLASLYAALFLLTLFTGYIIALQNYSHYIPCSCGGILNRMTWNQHIIFNCIFILLTIVAILLDVKKVCVLKKGPPFFHLPQS
jgi:uncharacterized membrane protein YphA (DoxX/SURF4 family)